MYLKHFQLHHSPFAEEPDPDIFFADGGGGAIYTGLEEQFRAGAPLIRLIGNEGSGKTMLCKVLLRYMPDQDFDVVYLDNPIGSFDDLLHIICLDLGMEPAVDADRNMLDEFRALLAKKKEQQKKVVLIVDEAEKLFMASLERLLHTVCQEKNDQVLHVLLSARPALDENLDQLTVFCDDIDVTLVYKLEDFSEEETGQYLHFRLKAAGLPPDSREQIFSSEAVHKIFASAKGNIRLINLLAEEALQASSTDKSFLVLLDHVAEQVDKYQDKPGSTSGITGSGKTIKLLIAGVVIAGLSFLFYQFGFEKADDKKPVTQQEQPSQDTQVVGPSTPVQQQDQLPPESKPEPEKELVGAIEEIQTPDTASEPEEQETQPEEPTAVTVEEEKEKEKPVIVKDVEAIELVEPDEPVQIFTAVPVKTQPPVILDDDILRPEKPATADTEIEQQSVITEGTEIAPDGPFAVSGMEEQSSPDQDDLSPVEPVADPGIDPELYQAVEELPPLTTEGLPILLPVGIVRLAPGMTKIRPEQGVNDGLLTLEPEQEFSAEPLEIVEPKDSVAPDDSVELINPFLKYEEVGEVQEAEDVKETDPADAVTGAEEAIKAEESETTEPEPEPLDTVQPANPAGEKMYQHLLNAGSGWLADGDQGSYTIQLMALNSTEAVVNLKEMLGRDEYLELKDKLFILEKEASPGALFVLYGSYNTMDQARNTRNTLPLYLRKHHPYALSRVEIIKKL